MTLNDDILSNNGLAPSGKGRTLIIGCGALAHEILAIKRLNGWDHIDLQCFPAILHNQPDKITDAVASAVYNAQGYDKILVAYADCGTGGMLAAKCKDLNVEMIAGPHCYSFFEGNSAFTARGEFTSFYLTDFLARQFDAFVWRPLGLDRHPNLKEMYFGNYEKLVYLAQTNDDRLTKTAEECAKRLGLAFERRFTGYGDLQVALEAAAAT